MQESEVGMALRTKGEQKAYLDGYETCAECIEKYLTDEGKQQVRMLLMAVRNAVEIQDIEPQELDFIQPKKTVGKLISVDVQTGGEQIQMIKELPPVIPRPPVMTGQFMTGQETTGEWVTTRTQAESEGENDGRRS